MPDIITVIQRPEDGSYRLEMTGSKEQQIEELKRRVKTGNEKLATAWLKIREITDPAERESNYGSWIDACKRLHAMCDMLKMLGVNDCIYLGANKRPMISCLKNYEGLGCLACTSDYPYWGDELFGGQRNYLF